MSVIVVPLYSKLKWKKTPKCNCPVSDVMNTQETFLELLQTESLGK